MKQTRRQPKPARSGKSCEFLILFADGSFGEPSPELVKLVMNKTRLNDGTAADWHGLQIGFNTGAETKAELWLTKHRLGRLVNQLASLV